MDMKMQRKSLTMRIVAWTCIAMPLLPSLALAGPVEDAQEHAGKGLELFKKEQFYDAALAFEEAVKLDPTDARNLFYCGRAWQQVGFWTRAKTLLERYLVLEKDEALRTKIMPKLTELRNATPVQIAAALGEATQKYPQARLEAEAAQAYEKLGDEASLRKAAEFWELARTAAANAEDRTLFTTNSRRVQARLLEIEQKKAVDPKVEVKTEAKVEAKAEPKVEAKSEAKPAAAVGGGGGKILLIGGGVLLVGGAVLAVLGASKGQTANDGAATHAFADYTAYQAEKKSADNMNFIGLGVAGLGAALAITGGVMTMLQGAPATEGSVHTSWQIAPLLQPNVQGLVFSGAF